MSQGEAALCRFLDEAVEESKTVLIDRGFVSVCFGMYIIKTAVSIS